MKEKTKREKRYVERDGKFYARVTFTDSTGKRRQLWRKAESRSDAKELSKKLSRELEGGTEPFEHKGTLSEYLDKWLVTSKQKVGATTYEGYVGLMRLYVRPVLGDKKLSALRPMDIQEMVNGMVKRNLSPRTVRYTHAVLFRSLKQAVKWRMLIHNPAEGLELPKSVRKEMQSLSPEQAQIFLEECAKDKHGLMFELALITGMRPEEYLGLQWSDVNFQKSTITIQRTLVWNKWKAYEWYFGEPKTTRSRRTIPIPSYLLTQMHEQKKKQAEHRLKIGPKYQNFNLVFASEIGTPISIRNLERRHFKPILKGAELPDIRLYDLRHSCATLLLSEGENPKVVSERLGHASIVLTLDTYSHVLPSMQQAATDKLERLLKKREA
jgi:integrase